VFCVDASLSPSHDGHNRVVIRGRSAVTFGITGLSGLISRQLTSRPRKQASRKVDTISPFQYNACSDDQAVTYLQGIKAGDAPGTYLLVGANDSPGPAPLGLAYVGAFDRVSNPEFNGSSGTGTWYEISVPDSFNSAGTSVYGPDNLGAGLVNYVGSFTRDLGDASPSPANPSIVGFAYTGAVDGSTTAGFREVQGLTDEGLPGTYTFLHSVDGGLAVGNTDLGGLDERTGYFSLKSTPFVLRLADGQQVAIRFPGNDADDSDLVTHTAYGIWYDGEGQYTIAGGSGVVLESGNGLAAGAGYLIDYDSITGSFSNYTEFDYQNRDRTDLITHFEGIYRDSSGVYWLPATSVGLDASGEISIASVVKVERGLSGDFLARAQWQQFEVRDSATDVKSVLSTGNSLFGNVVVGLASYPTLDGQLSQAAYVTLGN
jgi:hypothetical protein